MDSESKKLLQDTFALAEENSKLLHQIRRVQKRQAVWRVLKFIVIVGIAFGAFYFLEPYINKVQEFYVSVSNATQKLNDAGNSFQDFFKKF